MDEEPAPAPRTSIAPVSPAAGAGRVVFAIAWIALQIGLVITADRRSDGAFAFRMFPEASTIKVVLYREVAGAPGEPVTKVHVEGGEWTARDAQGMPHRFLWRDRVLRPELQIFDREIFASYGARTQVERLKSALLDVAAHVPDDAETKRFVLELTVRKNGHEPEVIRFASGDR